MLVLSRKRGESIKITSDGKKIAEIVVKNTSKGASKLGIIAGKEVSIQRSEIVPQNACTGR